MLCHARRCLHRSRALQSHRYLAVASREPSKTAISRDFIQQIERDGLRILRAVKTRVDERAKLLEQFSDQARSPHDIARAKQVKEWEPLQHAWREWIRVRQLLQETTPLLSDPDPSMRALALEEYESFTTSMLHQLNTVFPSLLVPTSPTASLSALIELKSGVGGSESSLFVADLLRMYLRFANGMKWKAQVVSSNELDGGGIKDAIVEIDGKGSYDSLRWETGIHRVQRVPATEASGRVHTSTVAVLVMPLSEEADQERNNELFSLDDVKIEVMRARGAGGQHVNTTESAVRLTHIPTGVTVSMQDERSQHQNKRRAFQVLSARLMDLKLTREVEARRSARRNLVGAADRSEKIRTYNYAQDRVSDHRIGLTLKNLTSVMEGEGLSDFISALKASHDEALMEEMLGE